MLKVRFAGANLKTTSINILILIAVLVAQAAHASELDLKLACESKSYWDGVKKLPADTYRLSFGKNETKITRFKKIYIPEDESKELRDLPMDEGSVSNQIFRFQNEKHGTFMLAMWTRLGQKEIPRSPAQFGKMKPNETSRISQFMIWISPKEIVWGRYHGDKDGVPMHKTVRCPITTAQWFEIERKQRQFQGDSGYLSAAEADFTIDIPETDTVGLNGRMKKRSSGWSMLVEPKKSQKAK